MPTKLFLSPMARRRKSECTIWMTLLCALLVLGGCSSGGYRSPYPPAGQPTTPTDANATIGVVDTKHFPFDGGDIVTEIRRSDCQISLHGPIHEESVRRLGQALGDASFARCHRRRLVLDVNDGSLGDAITMGSMLKNRGFLTAMQPGSVCTTPCLLVFAAGRERVIPDTPGTQLAFTQIPPDQDFGRNRCRTELTPGQSLTLARYIRAMLPEPTATAVYQKLSTATCSNISRYGAQEAMALGLATGTR